MISRFRPWPALLHPHRPPPCPLPAVHHTRLIADNVAAAAAAAASNEDVSPAAQESLMAGISLMRASPHTLIFRQGEHGACFYILLAGRAEVWHRPIATEVCFWAATRPSHP